MPANPPATNLSLMNQTGSTKILYCPESASLIKPLQDIAPSVSSHAIPDFEVIFESQAKRYPYQKGFDEARNDPILVLHSSGSTGETQGLH